MLNNIGEILLGATLVVGAAVGETAVAANEGTSEVPSPIQIIGTHKKDIGYIITNRNIVSVHYRVQFRGFYAECVSITIASEDGTKLSHMYNRCTEFVDK